MSVPAVCGGEIQFTSHASVSSPGSPGMYPPNRDCVWHLRVPESQRIQLHFFSMQIESHPNCSFDYLEVGVGRLATLTFTNLCVLDGYDSEQVLARYCNSTSHPAPLTSSSHELTLHFHSDAFRQDAGFQIAAAAIEGTPGCGGVFTDPEGTLTPPMDGASYRDNMNCGWKIQVPKNERLVIDFPGEFALEASTECVFDRLEVGYAVVLVQYCGNDRPPPLSTTSNTAYVVFVSDPSFARSGFTLHYEVFCGGVFTEAQGVITSPYFPGSYPADRRCTYEIRLPPRTAVSLQFLDFDVEHNSARGDCYYDYVAVRDGDNRNSTLLGTFCGEKPDLPDRPLVSTHNYMFIEFKTDSSLNHGGFRANYSAIDLGESGAVLGSNQ
ncbi:hypothetical protein FOCC_FOCC012480 [Frankliniella occidentalis]|nr:hypothetical protein FOCC_FOCC012480 [Frankliniella occidentalis]